MNKSVIMISGRSPLDEIGGGHCAYVRAHAYAASSAGYEVHIYCASDHHQGVHPMPYGVVHHIPAGGIPVRQRFIGKLAGPLAEEIVRDRNIWSRAPAIHTFGVWAYAGCLAVKKLEPEFRLRHIMSMYTVYREEGLAQLQASRGGGFIARLRLLIEWLHIKCSASRYEQYAYRQCDAVAVNYHSVEKLVLHMLGPHINLHAIPYCPEVAITNSHSLGRYKKQANQPLEVMTIALQRPKKGIRTLLEAFAILKQEGVPFSGRIVGGGAMMEANARHMQKLGLADQVTFSGFVENIAPLLYSADIYVQPSIREESGSLALLEAMRAGLPVICSEVDGMAEDVRTGTDGLTVPPGNAAKLAEAIKQLIRDADQRSRLATAAQERFNRRHGPEMFSQALKDLYEPV